MVKNLQLYLVDTNSFLIQHWPGFIFFMGTTWNPLLYESDSPISTAIPLSNDFEVEDVPLCCSNHGLEELIYSKSVPVLCITNPDELDRLETGLMTCEFKIILLDHDAFQLDAEITLDEMNEFITREFKSLTLVNLPKTKPILCLKMVPYIDYKDDLVIPQACDPLWKWWLGGLSPDVIIKCFENILEPKFYDKIKQYYSSPHK